MSQDSCDSKDEYSARQEIPVQTKEGQVATAIAQKYQIPSKQPYWKRLTFLNTCFNGVLAFTTILLVLVAYWQYKATNEAISISESANRISGESLRVSQDSFRISEESLRMSKESSEESIRSFQLDQRAWLGLKELNVENVEARKSLKATAIFTNTGKTPALNAKVRMVTRPYKTLDNMDSTDIDRELAKMKVIPSVSTIFPNAPTSVLLSGTTDLTDRDIASLKAGMITIYVFAKVTYSDVFNKRHTSRICARYSPTSNRLHDCEKYNEAD